MKRLSLQKRPILIALGGLAAILGITALSLFIGLPDAEEIKNFRPESTARVESVDWSKPPESPIRIWVPLGSISPLLQKAVVVSEDDLFYRHSGVNFDLMIQAFKVNWREKRYVRGASTITMQLARNAFLHKRKTILRKIREIILAKRIEKYLSKRQILELYLNVIEWGQNLYGAEAAAQYYFAKSAHELGLAEASLLAGVIPNPKYFNPYKRLQSCKRMQKRVLRLMQISRQITAPEAQMAHASASPLRGDTPAQAPAPIDSLEELKYKLPERVTPQPVDIQLPTVHATSTPLPDTVFAADSLNTKFPPDSSRRQ